MSLTPTAAKAVVGVAVELAVGEALLLPTVTAIATNVGFVAPTGSTGMRLHVIFTAWTTSGSFTINGTGTPSGTETVNIPAPTLQQLQSPQIANFEYVSVNAYTAITNVTTTGGATGAQLTVKGVQAAKFNTPATAFKSNNPMPRYSADEHNGLMARDKKLIAQENQAVLETFNSDWYGDLSEYWVYGHVGAPSWVTLPAAALSIVASATIIASMTIAGQPTAPGMKLIVVASTFAAGATLTVVGVSYGIAGVTEVITITGNGTFYSANVYSQITSIGGTTNATTVVITGVFGWKGTATSESVRSSLAVEHFDGSASWTHPSYCPTDGEFTVNPKAEAKLTSKGIIQDKLPIGDRTTNPLNTSRVAALGVPLSDLPAAGWQTQVYADPITGTAQTTVYTDPEDEIKITIKSGSEAHWTYNNQQEWTRVYPQKPEATVDLSTDIINLLQYEQERQNLKQYLVVALIGEFIGVAVTPQYKGWTWTLPVRYEMYGQEADPSKGNVFAKPKLRCEYDPAIGGAYQLVIVTRNPPTYNV
jgi:hypothetical protein